MNGINYRKSVGSGVEWELVCVCVNENNDMISVVVCYRYLLVNVTAEPVVYYVKL